jgi:alpha-galactosidase/6-phospho-beta-glucosidase family protein
LCIWVFALHVGAVADMLCRFKALYGDRDLLMKAMSLCPFSGGADFCGIGQLADELLLANKQWLPRFFD